MARSMWKGSVAFGLVSIPIELYGAVRDHRPRFRLLHSKDQSPVHYERVCEADGKPVAWEDLVKGYEYEKGHFVVLTKDDFKTAALEKTRTIDILDFVDADEIDERYFETPYYLLPGKGGDRAYVLLREALRDSGRIGIGKMVLREAQHLVALEVIGDALVLTMMRFAGELADLSEFQFPKTNGVRPQELTMARQLVEHLSAPWNPEKYTDDYRDNLMKIIAAKLKGRTAKLEEHVPPRESNVVDLMERLRASLAGKRAPETSARRSASKSRSASRKPPRKSARKAAGRTKHVA
jgi:DNA end-binding protein Ku